MNTRSFSRLAGVPRIEIDQAKACDLLDLAERYTRLRRVAATGGGEYAGPCPMPGCPSDDDGFRVQPERRRWLCRQCTNGKWQDAIDFQMRLTGQDFSEAVQTLTGNILPLPPAVRTVPPPAASASQPAAAWQIRAQEVIAVAMAALWSPCGAPARRWLHARGLEDETLHQWRLGYIPADRRETAPRWGLAGGRAIYLPAGVLIPCEVAGDVWYLKIRQLARQPKYLQVRGSSPALYLADTLTSRLACITEGELDALLLWQSLQHAGERWRAAGVATLGSQSACLDVARWGCYLARLDPILVLYDQDGRSDRGAEHWTRLTDRARIVHWPNLRPGDKDLTDYHLAGGDLAGLVARALAPLP